MTVDLQDILSRLNELDRQSRTIGVNTHNLMEEIRNIIFDIEESISGEDS